MAKHTLRTLALALLATATQASCGERKGASEPPAEPVRIAAQRASREPVPTAEDGASVARPTGFENTSWGMTREELAAAYPGFPAATARLFGREAAIQFTLDAALLTRILVTFRREYQDMDECGADFDALRALLDREVGRSQADNLSARWLTETSEVYLQCDPTADGEGTASMVLVYQPAESGEQR